MENLGKYFFGFFDFLDNGWKYLSVDLIKSVEFNYKDPILNQIKYFETRMKQYNPITLLIGTVLMLMTIFYIFKFLKRNWRKISKRLFLERLNYIFEILYNYFGINISILDSKEKFMDWVSYFVMLLPSTQEKMKKAKADIHETVKDAFKTNRFKRIEFQDKGLNENNIITKLASWYLEFFKNKKIKFPFFIIF